MKLIGNKYNGPAIDSIALTFVKVITAMLGLLTTKILSTQFSLQQYGTYSQAMLLVSTVTSLSILGLTDAVNYFYNTTDSEETKQHNISTVFAIEYFVGIFAGLLVSVFSLSITNYFKNEDLQTVIFIAAWLPLFENLIPMLQVLFISIGKAKIIAIRNFVVSVARVLFVAIACYVTKDVRTIFILILALDILQTVYFFCSFSKYSFTIRLKYFKRELIKPILCFSIPMAIYVFTSALSRDIDKYVIGFFTNTETLAIYTNAAKMLPFDMITISFMTVLIPILTRYVKGENFNDAKTALKSYLRIGYLTTWILVAGAIVNAENLMLFFYDEKYLAGVPIFIIYLLVDMMRFANTSVVLTAKGETRTLMLGSIISLVANFVLNIAMFLLFGWIGPAITTLAITIALLIYFLQKSATVIKTGIKDLFDWKELLTVTVQIVITGIAFVLLKGLVGHVINSYLIELMIFYPAYVGIMILLNKKRLIESFKDINQFR